MSSDALARAAVEVDALDDERMYEAALGHCDGVTGFHHWFFLEALAEGFGLRPRGFLITRGGEPIGLVPVILRPRGPFRSANLLPLMYAGPIARKGELGGVLAAIEPVLRRERVVATKWSFAPSFTPDAAALHQLGFHIGVQQIFVIPHAVAPQQRWRLLSGNLRRVIRQLRLDGAECGPSTREEIVEVFPSLATAAWRRQGLPPPVSGAVAKAVAEHLIGRPEMLWRSVRMDGEFMALLAGIVHRDRLWGWKLVGPHITGRSPHALAYWDMIEQCGERRLDFDLGGAPTEGIGQLKARLGGELQDAVVATRESPMFERVEALRSRLARARAAARV